MASLTAGVLASVLTFTNPFSPGARTGFPFRDFPQLSSFHISLIHNLFEFWYLIGYLTGSPIPIDIKPQPQPHGKVYFGIEKSVPLFSFPCNLATFFQCLSRCSAMSRFGQH